MAAQTEIPPRLIEAIRQGEIDDRWLEAHPEALEPYRGEWVVVYQERVIAHAPDAREVARLVPAAQYPGSTMFYVPTREESAAVRIL